MFLGSGQGEIVVSYPASLDVPGQAGRKTFRFQLHNLVKPGFAVQIARDENGLFTYDYLLRNGESARQSIRLWSFVGPPDDSKFEVSCPGWSASKARTATARQVALPSVPQLGAEVIFFSRTGNDIQPGNRNFDPFHVTSSYSPGFTTAFVRSGAAFDIPSELPSPVGDQIGMLARPEWDSQVVLILGPRFSPDTSGQAIAADFHIGISRLVRSGQLNGESAFVKEALAALGRSVQSGGIPAVRDVVNLLPKASPGIESEIATAMQVSPR